MFDDNTQLWAKWVHCFLCNYKGYLTAHPMGWYPWHHKLKNEIRSRGQEDKKYKSLKLMPRIMDLYVTALTHLNLS